MIDEIVAEVRKIRDAYAAQHGYDVHRICRDLRRRQSRSGRATVDLAAMKRHRSAAK